MAEVRAGRPRSESTRLAILQATADLTAEVGYSNVTIEAIAARAGAGKQTIYRWWSSKALILADAAIAGFLDLAAPPVRDTGQLDADLKAWVLSTADSLANPAAREVVRALASAASDDSQEAGRLYEHSTGPQYEALLARLRAGQAAEQLSAAVDPVAIADALMGTVLFRLLAGLPISSSLTGIVDALLASSSATPEA
ncbi:TetR/AcrR family transcriptional regulator [Cryobacterium sp. AP23]